MICDNPGADGIVFASLNPESVANSVAEGNHVMMRASLYGGITFYGSVIDSVVQGNRIDGSGAHAMQIASGFSPDEISRANTFSRNHVAGFHSTGADIFLDVNAFETVLRCQSGTLDDQGRGTKILGCEDAEKER